MISECQFLNGTERVRFLERQIYNRQQYAHFDSDVGKYVADTPLGERPSEYWNSNAEILEYKRGQVDRYCRHNYGVFESFTVQRSGECRGAQRGRTGRRRALAVGPQRSPRAPQWSPR